MNAQDSTVAPAVKGEPHRKEKVVHQISLMGPRGPVGTNGRQCSFEYISLSSLPIAIEWPSPVQSFNLNNVKIGISPCHFAKLHYSYSSWRNVCFERAELYVDQHQAYFCSEPSTWNPTI